MKSLTKCSFIPVQQSIMDRSNLNLEELEEFRQFSEEIDYVRSAHRMEPYDDTLPDGGPLLARKQGKFLQVANFHQFGLMKAAFNRQLEKHRILTLDLEGVGERVCTMCSV